MCIEVNQLRAERGVADRRESLEGTLAAAQTKLDATDATKTIGSADTASVVLAAQKFGWTVEGETVDLLKGVGTAFGVELFAALLIAGWSRGVDRRSVAPASVPIAAHQTAGKAPALDTPAVPSIALPAPILDQTAPDTQALGTPAQVSGEGQREADQTPEIAGSGQVSGGVWSLDVAADPARRLVQLVSERGGDVSGSHTTFGLALGITRGHVGAVLAKVSASGLATVETTKRGTRVRLVGAALSGAAA